MKPEALQQLEKICRQYPRLLHRSHYLAGLVFAVSAAPEIPMPDVWLGWAFKQRGAGISESEIDHIAEVLMGVLQHELANMRENLIEYPEKGKPLPDDLNQDIAVSQWLQGLLTGHSHLESVWQSCWQQVENQQPDKVQGFQRDLKHCLLMFSSFANIPMALEQAKKVNNLKLLDNLPKIYASLPTALKTYVDLSGQLAKFLPHQFETFSQPNSAPSNE
ncbi:UPF0149 family protein [Aliiglaciecola sp. 3_MG-2023]|nr:UPF0149 family protein [Aliiglaciecola sp. 3_MG-2023]MDO6694119.1 UPF0149 family protein [Aliiglaciecola sp. 3_MG-2023]